MGGIKGASGIIKLVAFILAAATFVLSILVYKQITFHLSMLAGAVFAGFFWYYLVAFVGMLTGNDLDGEVSKTWAIYASVAYFGAGLRATLAYSGSGDNDRLIAMICGILAIATSVLCFLDAFFGEG